MTDFIDKYEKKSFMVENISTLQFCIKKLDTKVFAENKVVRGVKKSVYLFVLCNRNYITGKQGG